MKNGRGLKRTGQGFTISELLCVTAVISVLAGLSLPALFRGKSNAVSILCANNVRQLLIASGEYSDDSSGSMLPNTDDSKKPPSHRWVNGNAGIGASDEFNVDILADPKSSLLAHYLSRQTSVYRCPADRRIGRSVDSPVNRNAGTQLVKAARSVSINQAIGVEFSDTVQHAVNAPWLDGVYGNTWNSGPYRTYGRIEDFVDPGPENTWMIIDESTFNLNDGAFAMSMVGGFWLDFPGRYHAGGAVLGFVDGHTERHQWKTKHNVPKSEMSDSNPDWIWLSDRTSARR